VREIWDALSFVRRAFLLPAVLAAGLSMTGCARFTARPLSPEKSASGFDERSLTAPGLRGFMETNSATPLPSWPLAEWALPEVTLAAFYYQPELDVARAKWATASAGLRTAGERPNPTLSVIPAYNTTTHIPSPWLVTPTLDIPIETAGKRRHRLEQSRRLAEAARLKLLATATQIRSRVRRSFLDLYAAGENQRLLREQQSLQNDILGLEEGQYKAGAISAFELTQARLAAGNARLSLIEAERQQAEAMGQLAEAVGVPAAALGQVRFSFLQFTKPPAPFTAAEARKRALLTRPDVLASLSEYAASEAALRLEIAKQYPDVHLNPGYEFDQGDNKWSLGLTVTLPVLNQNQGAIAEAEARRVEARESFLALQAKVVAEIDRALAVYDVALRKAVEAQSLVSDLEKQERAARAMLDAGEIARGELTAVRLQLSTTALARSDAIVKSHLALGQLEDALQAPLEAPATAWETTPERSASNSRSGTSQ
jgi:cobalt-zinc-cadmium efflux system outer membrane protein